MWLRMGLGIAIVAAAACAGKASARADSARLTEICRTTTNMGAEVCDCVGKKASEELTPDALSFLVASMDNQEERAEELRGKLGLAELTKAGMFFVTAPASCSAGRTGDQ